MTFSDLAFGVVDNLSHHKPENVIYLRLAIPRAVGNVVEFKLSYFNYDAGTYIDLYKNGVNDQWVAAPEKVDAFVPLRPTKQESDPAR